MKLNLVRGRLLRRYQRFLADVVLPDGTTVTAYVPNTGSMATLLAPDAEAWLAFTRHPGRKLDWTLQLLGLPGGALAVVDTRLPNAVVAEGLAAGRIPELAGYGRVRTEVPYGQGSRIDLLLESADTRPACHVEVKNVTMAGAEPGRADFPDAITARGRKHLEELATVARAGGRAVQFFLVDRSDCASCGVASYVDPVYAEALRLALAAGVEMMAYRAAISPGEVVLGERCPFVAP